MNKQEKIEKYYQTYIAVTKKNDRDLVKEDRYAFADVILREEFTKTDCSVSQIYKKVVLLNALYSTSIMATFDMTLHISKIENFMKRVKDGDISLVDEFSSYYYQR